MRRNAKRRVLGLMGCLAILLLIISGCVQTTAPAPAGGSAAPNFPTKEVTLVIPVSPGGGFDTAARLLAPHLEKYLPGDHPVVVKNMPGGEWNIGIGAMYTAQPDGHTLAIFNMPGNVVNQIVGTATFDLQQVSWLGTVAEETYVAALSPKSPYKTVDDLKNAPEVKAGVVGLSSTAGLGTLIAAASLGIKLNPIPHDGSTEAVLAAIRGDVDWVQYPLGTLAPYVVDSKELTPFVVYANERLPDLPDVPTIGELGYPQLVDSVALYRTIGTTPGVDPAVKQILEDALWQALNDPDFQAEMRAAKQQPSPGKGDAAARIAQSSLDQFSIHKDLILEHRK